MLMAIRRILYYTHNSIGIGHVFRARAIITGIQRWRPDIDFIVLSGTSVPHILLREGIEVVKLPGVEKVMNHLEAAPSNKTFLPDAVDRDDPLYKPRHLKTMRLESVMKLRQRLIGDTCRCFSPDVVMVEHYLDGLLGEMTAVLKKNRSGRCPGHFISVALSRGIMNARGEMLATSGSQPPEKIVSYYDYIYFFDDIPMLNRDDSDGINKLPSGTKRVCLGKITDKCRDELSSRSLVHKRFQLADKPIILISLSRHGDVAEICLQFFDALHRAGLDNDYQMIFVIDPYLKKAVLEKIQNHPLASQVRFLPFFYPLVDIINASELVICRAGYNTINELLLTGVKAIVIPEAHPSGEQEARIETIPRDNIAVLGKEEVFREMPVAVLRELIERKVTPLRFDFDKYAIGRRIITDLEAGFSGRHDSF